METKRKINKWNIIKGKNFLTAKEIINRMKRQPADWKKIFENEATNKRLLYKIYKQLILLSIKKKPNQKIGGRSEYTFLQRYNKVNKHMKGCHQGNANQ